MMATSAGIAYTECMQYTIRGVPHVVDAALRRRARTLSKSLNDVVIEALADGAGVRETRRERRDLADISGTWVSERSVDDALAAQDVIDEDLWR